MALMTCPWTCHWRRCANNPSQLRLMPSRCKLRPTEMTIETIVGRPMGGRERQLNTQTTKMVLWVVVAAGVRCELQRDRRTKNSAQIQKPMG